MAFLKLLGDRRWELKIEEAEELAEAAEFQVIGEALQTREKPDSATFFGSGKIEEIREKAKKREADFILVYNDLTSKQKFNIERRTDRRVIDKYDLILEIFEKHAHDAVSKLQVKLARIARQIPYMRHVTSKTHRGEKPYTQAGGEIPWRKKISDLRRRRKKVEEKLEKRRKDKIRRIKSRKDLGFITGAFVGYYNAGKTSIFNLLSEAEKPTDERPFTTVQGKVSKLDDDILLVDTIGFVKDIEPGIINAFRINMEDIKNAEFLLLTIDISDPLLFLNARTRAVVNILKELGVFEKVQLGMANKVDLVEDETTVSDRLEALRVLTEREFPIIKCSAKTRHGIEQVKAKIKEITHQYKRVSQKLSTP